MRLSDTLTLLERSRGIDPVAAAARDTVQNALRNRTVKDALHGVWLGHPLHPALAQLSLGALVSASLIDLVGGSRRESSRLIALGLANAPPTVAAGWADYADAHEEQQRVGVVHAGLNALGATAYVGTLVARSRGRSSRALSLAGGAAMGIAAFPAGTWAGVGRLATPDHAGHGYGQDPDRAGGVCRSRGAPSLRGFPSRSTSRTFRFLR